MQKEGFRYNKGDIVSFNLSKDSLKHFFHNYYLYLIKK